MKLLDLVRDMVRKFMKIIASFLNKVTKGHLSPNLVTLMGLAFHVPIGFLIAASNFKWAALLLVVFGLFDTLDGELARLQKRASSAGMLLDASTDRMKEVILYTASAYAIVDSGEIYMAVWAVVACGASLCVSYIKAKGETAVNDSKLTSSEINRLFADGLARFEVRMFILVVGLLTGKLVQAVVIIAVLSGLTAFGRLFRIFRKLNAKG